MKALVAFASGALFALGLGLGGMTQPAKVLAFLDVSGRWDPSLAFVLAGAIAIHALAVRVARRWPAPLLEERFHLPTKTAIDRRLVGGAALFGLGWGLAGYCPGPAITSAASGSASAAIVVAAMIVGMMLERLYESAAERARRKAPTRAIASRPSGRIAA
jgi:uncharacterized protein